VDGQHQQDQHQEDRREAQANQAKAFPEFGMLIGKPAHGQRQ